jgi:glycosyltransferase involved in cell wall biosynthesis
MKIAFVSIHAGALFCPGLPVLHGGAERGISLVARELARRGHEVHVFSTQHARYSKTVVDGVHVHLIPAERVNHIPLFSTICWNLGLASRLFRLKPEIMYNAGADVLAAVLAVVAGITGSRFVFRLANDRDLLPELDLLIGARRRRLFVWGLKRAHAVIAQTTQQIELLHERYGMTAYYVPNCKIIPKLLSVERMGLLWVGRFTPDKQLEVFLELAQQMAAERCLVIGRFMDNSKYSSKLADKICSLSNVTHLNDVKPDDMDKYYAAAKIFISTSRREGFPNTFLEASLQATPILSIGIDPDGYLGQSGAGLVLASSQELAAATRALLNDDNAIADMGMRGRNYVSQSYNVHQVVDYYESVFRLALRGK